MRAPERGGGLEILGRLLQAGGAPREQRCQRVVVRLNVVGAVGATRGHDPAERPRSLEGDRKVALETPLRIASVSSRSASGVGGSAAPAITLDTGTTGCPAEKSALASRGSQRTHSRSA